MNEPLNEAELRGLEGQPDPLYSYAILRRSAAEIRTLRARLSRLSALLDEAEAALGPVIQYAARYRMFMATREKMHPEGLALYDEEISAVRAVAAKIAKEKSE